MDTKTKIPECVKDGITFWPIPDFDDVRLAFGADSSTYFDCRKLPEVPRKFVDMANNLFFSGGELPEFAPCVDRTKAARAIRAMLSSWGPSHESKESTVGYALWLWATPEALPEMQHD